MFTTYADFTSGGVTFPVGQDDGAGVDASLLDRVVTLWVGAEAMQPSVRFGASPLNIKTVTRCAGRWQLHVFTFAAEARQAKQTLRLLTPATECEAAARPNGGGLLLVREDDGAFDCRIVDRRTGQGNDPLIGSWTLSPAVARRAALHIPPRGTGRAEAAARMIAVEFDDPEEIDTLQCLLGSGPTGRCIGRIRPQDVVNAVNRLLEPLGVELSCSDRQVLAAVDAHLATMRPDIDSMVDRIAHELLAELAPKGCIG